MADDYRSIPVLEEESSYISIVKNEKGIFIILVVEPGKVISFICGLLMPYPKMRNKYIEKPVI